MLHINVMSLVFSSIRPLRIWRKGKEYRYIGCTVDILVHESIVGQYRLVVSAVCRWVIRLREINYYRLNGILRETIRDARSRALSSEINWDVWIGVYREICRGGVDSSEIGCRLISISARVVFICCFIFLHLPSFLPFILIFGLDILRLFKYVR